jgi:hypothetical protein
MNAAQIHLALNHAPLFLSALGSGILILGMLKKNESFKILALWLLQPAPVFTIPVFTGEGTEELVEHLPGVNEMPLKNMKRWQKFLLSLLPLPA